LGYSDIGGKEKEERKTEMLEKKPPEAEGNQET
jgi:hypothetical protein